MRDKQNFLLMIFMPTILIAILSIALNDEFVKKDMKNIDINFVDKRDDLVFLNIDILEKILEDQGFLVKYGAIPKKNNKFQSIYIEKNKNNEINMYYEQSLTLEALIVEDIINTSLKGHSSEVTQQYIEFNNIYSFNKSFIINNYSISMITLTILFAAVTGAYSVIKEKNNGTLKKILTMPISIKEIIVGKFLGSLIISGIQIIFVILISENLFNITFGNNKPLIISILLSEAVFAISLGSIIGCIVKDNKSCWIILLSSIMTFALIGGAFVPFNKMNPYVLKYISRLSPITYINNSIFNIIYLDDIMLGQTVIIMLLSLTIIFLICTIILLGGENANINRGI